MQINLIFFQFACWKSKDFYGSGCWFKIFGWGLHFTNGEMLFSERYGLQKRLKLPFGYRVRTINPLKDKK